MKVVKGIVYKTNTGEITETITCPKRDFPKQTIGQGCSLIEIDPEEPIDYDKHYIRGGRIANRPEAPSPFHTFDYIKRQWLYDYEKAWEEIRRQRNDELLHNDWRVLPDAPLSQDQQRQWAQYRQRLRDITKQQDPQHIEWPQKPDA
mgnify:CR=1 FL=1